MSRESLERLSFIQIPSLASFPPIHFIFHLISFLLSLVSRSLSSPSLSLANFLQHDCRLASRRIKSFHTALALLAREYKKGRHTSRFLSAVS